MTLEKYKTEDQDLSLPREITSTPKSIHVNNVNGVQNETNIMNSKCEDL